MLLVICGAGASFDSVPAIPPPPPGKPTPEEYRPPLARELFELRPMFIQTLAQYPECRAIIPFLRKPKGTTLEGELQRLQEEAESFPKIKSQLAAVRYYLQQMLFRCEHGWNQSSMGITNYRSLLHIIEQWRQVHGESVCFVTFNYDTLIEEALSEVDLRIKSISDYISGHSHYALIKLHGSVTWSREVVAPRDFRTDRGADAVRQELISRAADLRFGERYIYHAPFATGIYSDPTAHPPEIKIVYPAIAIPIERKIKFECPKEHIEVLCSRLPKVKRVLIIGWRGMEESFLALMKDHLQAPLEVMVVEATNESAKEVERQLNPLIESRTAGGIQSVVGGFTQFIENRNVVGFLEGQPDPTFRLP